MSSRRLCRTTRKPRCVYLASLDVLDSYVPTTPLEFVRAFSVRFANGLPPTDDMTVRLVEIARDLAGQTRVMLISTWHG